MGIVGVIEVVAGIGVWLRPKIFAPIVAAWLGLIILTLILAGGFWDIALRDFGLLLGALALWRLARAHSACLLAASLLGNPHSPVARGPHG